MFNGKSLFGTTRLAGGFQENSSFVGVLYTKKGGKNAFSVFTTLFSITGTAKSKRSGIFAPLLVFGRTVIQPSIFFGRHIERSPKGNIKVGIIIVANHFGNLLNRVIGV